MAPNLLGLSTIQLKGVTVMPPFALYSTGFITGIMFVITLSFVVAILGKRE